MRKYRNDIILIVSIILIAVTGLILFNVLSKKENIVALVYCDENLVEEIDINSNNEYIIKGKLSDVKIIVEDNSIFILESECSDQICVHQGKINKAGQTITCLPNKVYIKLVGSEEGVDGTV